MILSKAQIKAAMKRGEIRFSPQIEDNQIGDASIDLRLGFKFTKFNKSKVIVPLARGLKEVSNNGLWHEENFPEYDEFRKRKSFCLEPDEFILAQTYETIWIPRNLIARVEGRSTYARVGLSMHQTAPWLQPGWDGQITLEIRNSGELRIELMPIDDRPVQVTFFKLTSKIPANQGYGSRPTDAFQHQTDTVPKK